jgi:hypothetical protein
MLATWILSRIFSDGCPASKSGNLMKRRSWTRTFEQPIPSNLTHCTAWDSPKFKAETKSEA